MTAALFFVAASVLSYWAGWAWRTRDLKAARQLGYARGWQDCAEAAEDAALSVGGFDTWLATLRRHRDVKTPSRWQRAAGTYAGQIKGIENDGPMMLVDDDE